MEILNHLENFEISCKAAGLKITHQRLEIFKEVLLASDHPTAETLHQRLRRKLPMISLDTVYRTLTTLSAHHLINKVETTENLSRYEVVTTPHHHLICDTCTSITDFTWPLLDRVPLPEEVQSWGRITTTTVVAHGTCAACRQQCPCIPH